MSVHIPILVCCHLCCKFTCFQQRSPYPYYGMKYQFYRKFSLIVFFHPCPLAADTCQAHRAVKRPCASAAPDGCCYDRSERNVGSLVVLAVFSCNHRNTTKSDGTRTGLTNLRPCRPPRPFRASGCRSTFVYYINCLETFTIFSTDMFYGDIYKVKSKI